MFNKTDRCIEFVKKTVILPEKCIPFDGPFNNFLGIIIEDEIMPQYLMVNGKLKLNLQPELGPIVE